MRGGPSSSRGRKKKGAKKKTKKKTEEQGAALAFEQVRGAFDQQNPNDFTTRLLQILWGCGVRPSAGRGLLGDVSKLITSGDGSPLETHACGLGARRCTCTRRSRCNCDRIFADPDATRAYDSYRKKYFFGHWWYEIVVGSEGHDLPLGLELFPGHTTDFFASVHVTERVFKHMREHAPDWKMHVHIADTGQDSEANHAYLRERGILPVIPIRKNAPDVHPERKEVRLSPRAVPMCQAHVEMYPWGTSGPHSPQFVCPVKAGKLKRCPIAPKAEPNWRCDPKTRLGPTIHLRTDKHPRLFPIIARNSPRFHRLYAKRTASERSNSMKKRALALQRCQHRRHSFWLCRLYFAALLQHAKVWATEVGDPRTWIRELISLPEERAAA